MDQDVDSSSTVDAGGDTSTPPASKVGLLKRGKLLAASADRFDARVGDPARNGVKQSPPSTVGSGLTLMSGGSAGSSGSGGGGKKLKIKGFSVRGVEMSYHEQTLAQLQEAVIAIQEAKPVTYNYESLYMGVLNMCEGGQAEMIYSKLRDLLEKDVLKVRERLPEECNEDVYMAHIQDHWTQFCDRVLMIRSIFFLLDRTYVLQSPSVLSIWDLGLELFRESVIAVPLVRARLIKGLLQAIEKERKGDAINRALLKTLLRMLCDLQTYKAFETEFLKSTDHIYAKEGAEMLDALDLAGYLHYVDRRLKEEKDRVLHYLDSKSEKPLVQAVEKQLIGEHVAHILQKGLDDLFKNSTNREPDLKLLYSLFARTKTALASLCTYFSEYVKRTGETVVHPPLNDDGEGTVLVQELLDFKDQMDGLVANCFDADTKFQSTLKESFEKFINTRQNKPAELIAKYVDAKLRAGNKEATEEELERLLDKIMVLFRFIHGKDVFEAFYKKDLAKRLLLGKSASVDAEKSMLSKLKQECGGGFTSKLEGMFKDMEISRDLMLTFKPHLASKKEKKPSLMGTNIDMTVNVLTMGYWPTYTPVTVNLPPVLLSYQDVFSKFYLSKHSGRKLHWQPTLGHCVLKANFKAGTKELQVSLFQALVLLLFNDNTSLSYVQIKEKTNLPDVDLKRTLQSLACGKARVVIKSPRGKEVDEADHFAHNPTFTNKLYRIKINQIQLKETLEESQVTTERVFRDREYQIDAAVVRIMKMRKTLTHTQLIAELFDQLKFPVNAVDLKKRIESLIDRDYMSRDRDSTNTYHYVA